jgi:DNA-directed RNA polymerase beta' subunit
LKERPAIISRDPSLHKFNLTGFFLRPNPNKRDKTIKLNPLVFKGLAADNDGDQLNINVPASEDAKQEVIDKMLPSKSLISPKTFQPMFVPSNEAALGLFQMSTEKSPSETVHGFKTSKDVVTAFQQGRLHIGDTVKVG